MDPVSAARVWWTGAGVAMGLERLQMLFHKTDDIGKVITFSFREIE